MQRGDSAHGCAMAFMGDSTCRDAVRAVRCRGEVYRPCRRAGVETSRMAGWLLP